MLENKVLLITGGTGSFGNAVLDRLLLTDISEIRIFSRDEKKQDDMRKKYKCDRLRFYIGDVREPDSLREPIRGVDYVFHAAALKQVPGCEFFPMEAVRTNVLGTENVLDASVRAGVTKVVCLSTDKAAYPINAMGISKAMMEKLMVAKSRMLGPVDTVLCGTRYGNVMCSRGSVIPLFIQQAKAGLPVTVTDPGMTRYLQTLEEAVELVIYAFERAEAGDILVQKAPACTVGELARAILEMFAPEGSVRIIGPRHGEKLYETLLTREEMAVAEDLGRYYRIPADLRGLNYDQYYDCGELGMGEAVDFAEDYNSHNSERLKVEEIKKKLLEVEYVRSALGMEGAP